MSLSPPPSLHLLYHHPKTHTHSIHTSSPASIHLSYDNSDMKERQRWQPEEDSLLRAYANQYGPKEWNLIFHRMNKPLDRDPKSCFERWENYLKPGIKRGSLTPQEQTLVISLQAKYGNKWKKIASEVPGRTAKRLGKWWEVFKEKQHKIQVQNSKKNIGSSGSDILHQGTSSVGVVSGESENAGQGTYDHILETFAEKYVQPYLNPASAIPVQVPVQVMPNLNPPILSLGSGVGANNSAPTPDGSMVGVSLPRWMNQNSNGNTSMTSSSTSRSATPSPSVSLTLSPSEPVVLDPVQVHERLQQDHPVHSRFFPVQQMGNLVQYCKEVEEAKQNWVQHKKEATWRLNRLEQQLEAEKNRKRREKIEEIEAKIRLLREEETAALGRTENEYREQLTSLQRDAEGKEMKLMEAWSNKQMKLSSVVEQINGGLIQHQHMISGTNHNHHHHHGLN